MKQQERRPDAVAAVGVQSTDVGKVRAECDLMPVQTVVRPVELLNANGIDADITRRCCIRHAPLMPADVDWTIVAPCRVSAPCVSRSRCT